MRVIRGPYHKVDLSSKLRPLRKGPRLWKADSRR